MVKTTTPVHGTQETRCKGVHSFYSVSLMDRVHTLYESIYEPCVIQKPLTINNENDNIKFDRR